MLLRPWMAPVAAHLFTRRSFAIGLRIAHGRGARRAERDIEEYYAAARDPRFIRSLIHLVHEIDWDPLPLAELRSIHAPVLVIAGRQDRIIPPRNLEQVVREIPTSRLVLLPEAGHMSNEEAPELVNPLLVGFLRPGAAP
jgi:3-oxoadipate enol-lactonase